MRYRVNLVQTPKTQSLQLAIPTAYCEFICTMTIYINLLSNFKISFDFKGNNPAISALSGASAEVEGLDQEGDDRKAEARRISDSLSNATLVDDDRVAGHPQWIAGVGDIFGSGDWARKQQWTGSGNGIAGSITTSIFPKNFGLKRSINPTKPLYFRQKRNNTRSALQRHCDFWDTDGDGLIYPWDIYRGFRRLGFHFALCLWAAITMAIAASYNTHTSWIPHPLFAINLNNINSNRHGSSTGTYDMDGELDERRFEAIFEKYAQGKDYLTLWSTYNVWRNQRCGLDFFGWFAGGLECKQFSSHSNIAQ